MVMMHTLDKHSHQVSECMNDSCLLTQFQNKGCTCGLYLGEVYSMTLGLSSSVALSKLSHHLHQVTSLGGSFSLDLNLPPPPPPLSRHGETQGVVLQHQGTVSPVSPHLSW